MATTHDLVEDRIAAARGGATRLVLTHLLDGRRESDARAAAELAFKGEVSVAQPGLEVEVR